METTTDKWTLEDEKRWQGMVAQAEHNTARRELGLVDDSQVEWYSGSTIGELVGFVGSAPISRLFRGVKNIVMLLVILAAIILPAKFALTCYLFGDMPIDQVTGYLSIATVLLVVPYAPWYWLLTLLPMLAALGSLHPESYRLDWQVVLLLLGWGLYGLLKGLYHETIWMRESWNDEHHHSTIEHPYLLAGSAVGMRLAIKSLTSKD